jgi:CheY-like chemotaxis protein
MTPEQEFLKRQRRAEPRRALRVLVADDHADSRLMIQTFLSLLGFVVRTAPNGEEALALALSFRPDVVFLDIWMPHLGGIDACEQMRAGPCPRPIPIFGVTGDLEQFDSPPPCFDRVLLKPLELEDFAALLREHEIETRGGLH